MDAWLGAPDGERRAAAESLLRALPSGFRFVGLDDLELATHRRPVATFTQHGRNYVLVPGGTFTAGWSAEGWSPRADEAESYAASAAEYGIDETIAEHLTRSTRPRRRVTIPPLLVETTAEEVGWVTIAADDPRVRAVLGDLPATGGKITIVSSGAQVRVVRAPDGAVTASASIPDPTHDVIARAFEGEGFRLPTSDEWEVLCGGGAETLFRWGDHVPCDRYPTDMSPEEAAWRRQWVLSGGTLARPPGGFAASWDLHRRPNAFGLHIAFDPYKSELVAEPDTLRGGDGGMAVCGGAGFFLGWLPLATAYFDEQHCQRDPSDPLMIGYTVARRVLTLA